MNKLESNREVSLWSILRRNPWIFLRRPKKDNELSQNKMSPTRFESGNIRTQSRITRHYSNPLWVCILFAEWTMRVRCERTYNWKQYKAKKTIDISHSISLYKRAQRFGTGCGFHITKPFRSAANLYKDRLCLPSLRRAFRLGEGTRQVLKQCFHFFTKFYSIWK
jgi:hypothetical protein